jgi:hypothetical protein
MHSATNVNRRGVLTPVVSHDNSLAHPCYCDLKHREILAINATNNAVEQAISGAAGERYRTMRGYKREKSILSVTGLTAWLVDQPVGYDMSPLFAS